MVLQIIFQCLAIPGNIYPATESSQKLDLVGMPIKSGYNSHFVIVTKKGEAATKADYENGEELFDELVVPQENQAVPMFLIELDRSYVDDMNISGRL